MSGVQLVWFKRDLRVRDHAPLAEAVRRGGHARIGFENSLWNRDGTVATDNAARVRELKAVIG